MATKGMSVYTHNGEDYTVNDPNVADEFSASVGYAAGEYVYYQGNLWRFKVAHSAGAWNADDVTGILMSKAVRDIESLQAASGTKNLFSIERMRGMNGITVSGSEFYGAVRNMALRNIALLDGMPEGVRYTVTMTAYNENATGSSTGLRIAVIYTDGTSEYICSFSQSQASWTIKTGTTSAGKTVQRFAITYANGAGNIWHVKDLQIEAGVTASSYAAFEPSAVDRIARPLLSDGSDMTAQIKAQLDAFGYCRLGKGTFTVTGIMMPEGSTLEGDGDSVLMLDSSISPAGYTMSGPRTSPDGQGYQKVYSASDNGALPAGLYKMSLNISTTYTATATSRVCFFAGETYSSGNQIAIVDVPRGAVTVEVFLPVAPGSAFCLSGHVTALDVPLTINSFVLEQEMMTISMSKGCTVRGLDISGSETAITPSSTPGSRNGIVWAMLDNQYGVISGCRIHDFNGSGILCMDTSTPVDKALNVSDCHIYRNGVGIHIRRDSEYHKFTGCAVTRNYYGSINRGGNNLFTGCGFDSNVIGMQIDADEGSNNGHGNITGCTFNHSNENNGYGIIIRGTGREMIGNCNFYYSDIRFENGNGNVVSGCGFGNNAEIEISGGGCSMIIGCIMRSRDNTVTLYNNTTAKVVQCWTREGYEIEPITSDTPI